RGRGGLQSPFMNPPLRLLSFLSLVSLLLPATLNAQTGATAAIAAGDAAYARRAEGHQGAKAQPGPVNEAIADFERAVKEQPDRLEGSWKLLRALHFKGDFVARTNDEKQKVFARGKEVAEAAIDRLAKRAGGRAKLDAMTPAQAAKALAGAPEAAPLFLWSAVDWGLWGDAFGRLAAARQGVGDKVRTYSEILNALDERYEDAAGHRVLGRLHTLAPKVPFLTEALFEHFPAKAAEARELCRKLLGRQPEPNLLVEQESTLAKAKELLA